MKHLLLIFTSFLCIEATYSEDQIAANLECKTDWLKAGTIKKMMDASVIALDEIWWNNRKASKVCQEFVGIAMSTGSPERGSFKQVQARLNAIYNSKDADKSHQFLRAFPDLYYFLLANRKEMKETFPVGKLQEFDGLILGDVHVENFGLIKSGSGTNVKFKFSVNDFDEVGQGPYYSDVLRLLTSAKMAEKDLDPKVVKDHMKCLLKAYTAGMKGKTKNKKEDKCAVGKMEEENENSMYPYSKNMLSAEEDAKKEYLESFVKIPDLSKMKDSCDDYTLLSNRNEMFTPDVPGSFVPIYTGSKKRCKVSGGSGLLSRTQYVVKGPQNKLIEVKTIAVNSAVAHYSKDDNKDHAGQMSKALTLYGLDKDIKIEGSNPQFIIREKDGGNVSYKPYKKDKEDRAKRMLRDQFYVLGEMHKKSMELESSTTSKKYLEKFDDLKTKEWSTSTKSIETEIFKYFNACSSSS